MLNQDIQSYKVLVIDDSNTIRRSAEIFLTQAGHRVMLAEDGFDALAKVGEFEPDLIFCDILMPRLDGYKTCTVIKQNPKYGSIPIVMLSSKDGVFDRARGRIAGSQDYMTKPFSLEELVARLRALLRRIGVVEMDSDDEKIRFADLELNEATHEVRRGGVLLEMSPTEFQLLRYLLINADRVVSKSQILDHVWQYDFRGDAGIVETYISYLRKKIDIFDPPLIHTVRGVGYRLRLPAAK